jgi:multiple sugar transport system substrate-binding protein
MTTTLRVAVRRFGPFESGIVKQFSDFCRVTGTDATIEAVAFDLNPLHETLFQRRELVSGAWDFSFLSTDWIAEAQAAGLVEDLAPFMAARPIADFPRAWSPSLLNLQKFAGGFWGMPYHDGPQCLIYRTDLLERAGIAPPATWDDFHAAARLLHDPPSGVSGTVLALFPDGHNAFYDFCIHLWTRGSAPFDAAGQPCIATPQGAAALDFLRGLARDASAVAPNLHDLDSVKSGLLFCEGKVALMANWFGFAAFGESWGESRVAGRVGIAPLPAGRGGASVSLNVFWMLAMARGSANKDLVWDFFRHCATPAMDKLTTMEGASGVRRSTWADAEVNRAVPYYHKLDELHALARELPVHPRLSDVAHVIDAMMTAATTTERPTAELLAEAQAAIESIVS